MTNLWRHDSNICSNIPSPSLPTQSPVLNPVCLTSSSKGLLHSYMAYYLPVVARFFLYILRMHLGAAYSIRVLYDTL